MKQPSLIFKIQRFIRFMLQGVGKKEQEHHLFTLPGRWTDYGLYMTLAEHGWQPNYLGYTYKGQIYQCRRLVGGKHQYHVRFYDDGKATGHMEIAPEYDTSDHLSGVDLRTMNASEIEELRGQLGTL